MSGRSSLAVTPITREIAGDMSAETGRSITSLAETAMVHLEWILEQQQAGKCIVAIDRESAVTGEPLPHDLGRVLRHLREVRGDGARD